MRLFIAAMLGFWLALVLVPDGRVHGASTIREKVWLSRACTDNRWYLAESDDLSATLECYVGEEGGAN